MLPTNPDDVTLGNRLDEEVGNVDLERLLVHVSRIIGSIDGACQPPELIQTIERLGRIRQRMVRCLGSIIQKN